MGGPLEGNGSRALQLAPRVADGEGQDDEREEDGGLVHGWWSDWFVQRRTGKETRSGLSSVLGIHALAATRCGFDGQRRRDCPALGPCDHGEFPPALRPVERDHATPTIQATPSRPSPGAVKFAVEQEDSFEIGCLDFAPSQT